MTDKLPRERQTQANEKAPRPRWTLLLGDILLALDYASEGRPNSVKPDLLGNYLNKLLALRCEAPPPAEPPTPDVRIKALLRCDADRNRIREAIWPWRETIGARFAEVEAALMDAIQDAREAAAPPPQPETLAAALWTLIGEWRDLADPKYQDTMPLSESARGLTIGYHLCANELQRLLERAAPPAKERRE